MQGAQTLRVPRPGAAPAHRADDDRGGHPGGARGRRGDEPLHRRPRAARRDERRRGCDRHRLPSSTPTATRSRSPSTGSACSTRSSAATSRTSTRPRSTRTRLLSQLRDALMTIDTSVPGDAWEAEGWQPYTPTAFRLYVRDVTGEPIEGGELPGVVREWPTDDDPAAFGEEVAGLRRRDALRGGRGRGGGRVVRGAERLDAADDLDRPTARPLHRARAAAPPAARRPTCAGDRRRLTDRARRSMAPLERPSLQCGSCRPSAHRCVRA